MTKEAPDPFPPFDEEQKAALDKLIEKFIQPPVLSLPRLGYKYSLDTDASNGQLGATLYQRDPEDSKKKNPIGYWSRTLNVHEKTYSTTEKECLSVVWALLTLRPYLLGEHFIVHFDHDCLRWLMNVTDPSRRLLRRRLRLSDFDFDVRYKKGTSNAVADALSRLNTKVIRQWIREKMNSHVC